MATPKAAVVTPTVVDSSTGDGIRQGSAGEAAQCDEDTDFIQSETAEQSRDVANQPEEGMDQETEHEASPGGGTTDQENAAENSEGRSRYNLRKQPGKPDRYGMK